MVHADNTPNRKEARLHVSKVTAHLHIDKVFRAMFKSCPHASMMQTAFGRNSFSCLRIPHMAFDVQLQQPDLLAVTGFPWPGRMVLGLLFTTG